MTVPATAPYAALLALLFIALSARVIRQRGASKVALGFAGAPVLERAARVHANFAEYVPLAPLLTLLTELSGYPRWLVHTAGLALVLGRLSHAWGVSQSAENFRFRVAGMGTTFGVLGILSLLLPGAAFVR